MDRITKSTPRNIIELYTKIPDYSEVKHLGNSEFINTLERLKEEFRQIRSSLYEDSDVEIISEKAKKVLNLRETKSRNDNNTTTTTPTTARRPINYLSSRCNSGGHYFYSTDPDPDSYPSRILNNAPSSYLAVKSCQLYRSPFAAAATATFADSRNLSSATKSDSPFFHMSSKFPTRPMNNESSKTDSAFHEIDDDLGEAISLTDSGSSSPTLSRSCSSPLSRWSSDPEISRVRSRSAGKFKEYVPPANIENRILQRSQLNRSEPALTKPPDEDSNPSKVHPVPANVKKLLFDKIMLNNKKRSQRVRESSKQKLLSQVKPFSFSKRNSKLTKSGRDKRTNEYSAARPNEMESLNNTKPVKLRKQTNIAHIIKTNNNKFDCSNHHLFRANPAPPRSRALLAALRLREQQEYRELKKRLRSETLMRAASLPPSMAARDKEAKDNQSRLQTILNKLENSTSRKSRARNRLRYERSSSNDTTTTDDDRTMSDTSLTPTTKKKGRTPRITTIVEPFNFSNESGNRKTPRSSSNSRLNFAGITNGVFESTANDNKASRLRALAAKRKEDSRIKREEEEQLRLMRIENARQNLRDAKLQVWRRACSYSSAQDIAMRRQLREASSILERQAFHKDMNTMLNRVRSAPLLLEGVRERKYEPCRKHLEEMLQLSDRSIKFAKGSTTTPRTQSKCAEKYCTRMNWTSRGEGHDDRCGTEMSETAALAEGTMTNSDNESIKNIDLDSDEEKERKFEEKVENEKEEIILEEVEEVEEDEDDEDEVDENSNSDDQISES